MFKSAPDRITVNFVWNYTNARSAERRWRFLTQASNQVSEMRHYGVLRENTFLHRVVVHRQGNVWEKNVGSD